MSGNFPAPFAPFAPFASFASPRLRVFSSFAPFYRLGNIASTIARNRTALAALSIGRVRGVTSP